MSGFARSRRLSIFAGLSLGTMMISRFSTKISGLPATRSSFTAVFISSLAAEAKTSAGAPRWIWVSRVELDSKLCFTVALSFCSSKVSPSSPNASIKDEAASMVSVFPPFSLSAASLLFDPCPQPVSPADASTEIKAAARRRRWTRRFMLLAPVESNSQPAHASGRLSPGLYAKCTKSECGFRKGRPS